MIDPIPKLNSVAQNMAGTATFAEIIDGDVFKYYADGEWKKSSSGKSVPIINPTTRKTHFKVQGTDFRLHLLDLGNVDLLNLILFQFLKY